MEDLNRRKFIQGAAAAAALNILPRSAEAQEEAQIQFISSTLTPEALQAQKEAAVASLTKSIPAVKELEYLRAYIPYLEEESQMYIPTPEELGKVVDESAAQLVELSSHIEDGAFGLFIFADRDERGGLVQRLYVLQKNANNEMQFIKGYLVSLAQAGFGNENGSEKTPIGLHTIHDGKMGMFGEVVSGLKKYKDLFNRVRYGGEYHWFVKGFGSEPGNDVAEVVTDQYLLVGPQTDVSRGIRIHGTNRSGQVGPDGTWQSFLGGNRRSGGCIRMSNTDIRDLGLSGYIHTKSPIMIYATETTQNAPAQRARPPRWIPPSDE